MIIMFISLVYDLFPVQMVTKSVVLMFTYKRTNAVQPSGSFYPLDVGQQTTDLGENIDIDACCPVQWGQWGGDAERKTITTLSVGKRENKLD